MDLISANEALNFLSRAAPQVWVQRALQWMILQDELCLHAEKVEVEAFTTVFQLTSGFYKEAGEFSGSKMDAVIRNELSPELADKLVGKDHDAYVYDEPHMVEGVDEVGAIDPGFVLFSDGIDWGKNQLRLEWLDETMLAQEWFFPRQNFVGSEFERATYKVTFSSLSFEASKIELLLPSMRLENVADHVKSSQPQRFIGRPPKWDWDGAMAYVIATAQTPDGLPTGHGAQAKIEAMIASWFEDQTGNSPAISQIRSKASRIMQMIEKD